MVDWQNLGAGPVPSLQVFLGRQVWNFLCLWWEIELASLQESQFVYVADFGQLLNKGSWVHVLDGPKEKQILLPELDCLTPSLSYIQ